MPTRKVTLPIVAGLALLAIVWFAFRDDSAEAPATKAAPVIHAAASAAAVAASEPTPRGRLMAARAQLSGTANDPCSLPAIPLVRQVAGAEPEDPVALKSIESTPAFQTFTASVRRIDAALRASSDPYANAVGIWLNLPRDETGERAVPEAERRHQLAAMAVATTDPRIYAMAFHTCRQSPDDGCYALNARRWAELDAGNAEPWVYLFHDAVQKSDVSGQEEALFHMAAASRMDERAFAPTLAIAAASNGSDADAMAVYALSEISLGMWAAQFEPRFTMTMSCQKAAQGDANRSQLCLKIADLLFEHSDQLQGRGTGAWLTWRMTGDASQKNVAGPEMNLWGERLKTSPATCDQLRQRTDWFESMATRGPQATLRAMGASSPP